MHCVMNLRLFFICQRSFKIDSNQTLNFGNKLTSKYSTKKKSSFTAAYVPNINSKQTLNFTTKQFKGQLISKANFKVFI